MQISQLSAQTGVSTHRLRRYESLGLIGSDRQSNGYRKFSAVTAKSVIFIDMSRKIGFSLDEIAELLPRYRAGTLTAKEMILAMQQKVKAIDELIASHKAQRQMLVDHIAWFKSRRRNSK